jgi:hypothetical protein
LQVDSLNTLGCTSTPQENVAIIDFTHDESLGTEAHDVPAAVDNSFELNNVETISPMRPFVPSPSPSPLKIQRPRRSVTFAIRESPTPVVTPKEFLVKKTRIFAKPISKKGSFTYSY